MGSSGNFKGFQAISSITWTKIRDAYLTGKAGKKFLAQVFFGGHIDTYRDMAPFYNLTRPSNCWSLQTTFADTYKGILGKYGGDRRELGKNMETDTMGTVQEIIRQVMVTNLNMAYNQVNEGDPRFDEHAQNYTASAGDHHHF